METNYIYIYIYIFVYLFIYIYLYIYILINIYIYIYTYSAVYPQYGRGLQRNLGPCPLGDGQWRPGLAAGFRGLGV